MAYLKKEDYTISISVEDLDRYMTAAAQASSKTQDAIRQEAEDTAEAEIRSYTEARYDMDTEFAKIDTDPTRARLVMLCLINISLYRICFTINPRNIPALRNDAYMQCVEHLKSIQDGTMTLPGVDEVIDPIAGTEIVSQGKFISKPFTDRSILDNETI